MKKRSRDLTDQSRIETLDALYTAAASLKGRDAMKRFLRDLLTESERVMLGRRILIARALLAGESYDAIASRLGVGHDTIRRVHRWLTDTIPGYEEAIDGLKKEQDQRAQKRRTGRMYRDSTAAGTIARLKKKYPLHFLLFPWPDAYKSPKPPKQHKKPKRKRNT